MSALNPEFCNKRSPVYRLLQGASFEDVDGGAHAVSSCNDSAQQRAKGGLIDLSLIPRCGVRGPGAAAWLAQQGLPHPSQANRSESNELGQYVLRLGLTEHWVLANPLQPKDYAFEISGPRCHPTYCEDSRAWFAITGDHRAQVMAKLCGVDLRREAFEPGAVVQTSLARVNVVVAHQLVNGHEVFSIFSDSASAEYLWTALLDAIDEFGGAWMSVETLS